MTSTPDPFLPAVHGNDNLPTHPISHVFGEDGRASASTFDSRDIAAMRPTEPNMSTTSFNGNRRGTGVIVTSPVITDNLSGYPLQNINTNLSAQSPVGIVMASSGKCEDGRSTYAESSRSRERAQALASNQYVPPQPAFSRQASKLSQRSTNSIHSQGSFSRRGPTQEAYTQERWGNPSQLSATMETTVSKPENVELGKAM